MTNQQVINHFVNQTKLKAKSSTGALYFEGNTIYSYGPHFKIAKLIGCSTAIITNKESPSITTTKQRNAIKGALSHNRFSIIERELK